MKTVTKYLKSVLPVAITAALSAGGMAAPAAGLGPKRGTDILHYFVRKNNTSEGGTNTATGQVSARQNQQGNANNQTFDINLKGLPAGTNYQLLVLTNAATNYTLVGSFGPDSKGRVNVSFRQLGNGKSQGKGKQPLPEVLDPVSQVRALAIVNASTQAVATADLTMPDKLNYLIKRNLNSNDVAAILRIMSNLKKTQIRLDASGLAPSNAYLLVFNGSPVDGFSPDSRGRLRIDAPLASAADILDLESIALWDTSSNVVLSTTLP